VPDLELQLQWDGAGPERQLLFEFKTLHLGPSTYPCAEGRCQAVKRRAKALPTEYARKARLVDEKYIGTANGEVGPVAVRLRRYEPVKGLVFGHFGEASDDVHKLVGALAVACSRRNHLGPEDDAARLRGLYSYLIKRRWALATVRGAARLTLSRLASSVGQGASAAAVRRQAAEGVWAQARRAACEPFWGRALRAGPRVF